MTKAKKEKSKTFEETLLPFGYRYSLREVFEDFVDMTICSVSQNPLTGKSYYEDEYLDIIEKYKDDDLRHELPKLFALLSLEMEERWYDSLGFDVLGSFYEKHLYEKGKAQFFTPWPICVFMAKINMADFQERNETLKILDPCVGAGRMPMCAMREIGQNHEFYGIDIDPLCVKMSALNFFLSGMFNSEVMCADALSPDDFRVSYRISMFPLGIFKVTEKEQSRLWRLHRNSFIKNQSRKEAPVFQEGLGKGQQIQLL